MAGGTSRKDHSEVGSSYIHFNYTPDGDKTTPSLICDVPRGVMLNQPPIFLGRQACSGWIKSSRISACGQQPLSRLCICLEIFKTGKDSDINRLEYFQGLFGDGFSGTCFMKIRRIVFGQLRAMLI